MCCHITHGITSGEQPQGQCCFTLLRRFKCVLRRLRVVRGKVRTILENLNKDQKKVKTALALTKFVDACESAMALAQTGPLSLDFEELGIALDMVTDENVDLPFPLQLQVTERHLLELMRKVSSEEDEEDESILQQHAQEFLKILEIWSVFSQKAQMLDDWDYKQPSFMAIAAQLEENPSETGAALQQQKQAGPRVSTSALRCKCSNSSRGSAREVGVPEAKLVGITSMRERDAGKSEMHQRREPADVGHSAQVQ